MHDIILIAIGMVVTRFWLFVKSNLDRPHRWSCSLCHFKIALNNKTVMDAIRHDHMAQFHIEAMPDE